MEDNRVLKREGRVLNISKDILSDQKILEVGNDLPENAKIDKDSKTSFEDYKTLYKGAIDEKCKALYGSIEDTKLWEDTAKEMYLKSTLYVPVETDKVDDELVKKESRRIIKHNKLNENKDCPKQEITENNQDIDFPLNSDNQEKYYDRTAIDTNGTLYDIYKINDKCYDINGNEIVDEQKECPKQGI